MQEEKFQNLLKQALLLETNKINHFRGFEIKRRI